VDGSKQLMRIGELAKAAGVSVQTIHYYVREGLLPAPIKTAPNMAYYGPEYLDDIRLIKELQENRYLPLSLIRQLLEAKRHGHSPNDLLEMRLALDDLFPGAGSTAEPVPAGMAELIVLTGLPLTVLERLEALGVIGGGAGAAGSGPDDLTASDDPHPPVVDAEEDARPRYDALDVRLGRALKKFLDLGLAPDDLEVYGRYVAVLREEAELVHDRVLHNRPQGAPRVTQEDLKGAIGELHTALRLRAFRLAVVAAHEGSSPSDREASGGD
jgi:DNA-binding transcriptional MerR regulator